MLIAILLVAALFALLFVGRVGAARRHELLARWPAVALGGVALVMLFRGAVTPAFWFGIAAAAAWVLWPRLSKAKRATPAQAPEDPADKEARALLGVASNASESEIRAAYRARIARAHPDLGGNPADAQKLTAARDRLVRRRR